MKVIDLLSEKLQQLDRVDRELAGLHLPPPPRAAITATLFGADGAPKLQVRDLARTWNFNYYKFAAWMLMPPEVPGHFATGGGFDANNFTALAQDGITHWNLPNSAGSNFIGLISEMIPNTTALDQGVLIGSGVREESSIRLMTIPQLLGNAADFIVTVQSTENAQLRYDTENQTWHKKLWKSYQNVRANQSDIFVTEVGLTKRMGRVSIVPHEHMVNVPYHGQFTTRIGQNIQPSWSMQTGFAWPPGIALTAANGVLAGTPSTPGTYPYRVTNTVANTVAQTYEGEIVILPAGSIPSTINEIPNTTRWQWFILDHTRLAQPIVIKHNELMQVNYDITFRVG